MHILFINLSQNDGIAVRFYCSAVVFSIHLSQTHHGDISLTVTSVEFSKDNGRKVVCNVSYIVDNNTGKEVSFIGASTTTALIYEGKESEPIKKASWDTAEAYSTISGSISFYLPKEAETSDEPIFLKMNLMNAKFKIRVR